MDPLNPFGVYFNLMKIRYAIYDDALSSLNFLKPTDKVNVFINLETALKYLSTTKDLEKKLVVNRNFAEYMKVDIINIAAHYKDFFKGNGLETKVFIYMTDLNSDSDDFKESKYTEDFRSYYLNKYTTNPKFALLGDRLLDDILPDVRTICEYIPDVYFITGKNIDGGMIPYIIGKANPDWKNIIISGDLHDTQYSYEQNFLDCFYNRSCVKGCLGFGPKDFLKAISKSEDIPDELVRLFTNASFYSSLLSVLGDRYRSIPNIKGIGFKTLIKSIEGGMKEKKINNETRSAMLLASIFPDDIQATMYNNLLVTDVQNEFDMLTDGDRKTILGQIIDRSDITALQLLNRTRFRNKQLRLEALLK